MSNSSLTTWRRTFLFPIKSAHTSDTFSVASSAVSCGFLTTFTTAGTDVYPGGTKPLVWPLVVVVVVVGLVVESVTLLTVMLV